MLFYSCKKKRTQIKIIAFLNFIETRLSQDCDTKKLIQLTKLLSRLNVHKRALNFLNFSKLLKTLMQTFLNVNKKAYTRLCTRMNAFARFDENVSKIIITTLKT